MCEEKQSEIKEETCGDSEERQPQDEQSTVIEQDADKNKKGVLAKVLSGNKDKVVKGGASAVVEFIVKKGVFALLTSILSAAIVFFTQQSFEETYKDYYKNFLKESEPIFLDVITFLADYNVENIDEFLVLDEEINPQETLRKLLKKSYSYSSENAEINKFHNQFTRVCEDMYDLYVSLKTFTELKIQFNDIDTGQDVYMVGFMLDSQISLTSMMEIRDEMTKFDDDLVIYAQMRSELFKKYGIDEGKYEFF